MKLLIISNLFPPYYLGGYEILCAQVVHGLEKKGHKAVVLTSTHGIEGKTAEKNLPNVHRMLKLYLPFDQPPQLMRRQRWRVGKYNYSIVKQVIARERPDVIFVWSQLRLTLGAARAAQDSGIPVAYAFNDETIAGYVPACFGLAPRAFARYVLDRWVFPSITLRGLNLEDATCISHLLKNNLRAVGVPIPDAKVIYQGIPIAQFPAKPEPGVVSTPARILYVGQLHPYKGVHTLIQAANLISEFGVRSSDSLFPNPQSPIPNLSVTIIGEGAEEYKRRLRDQATLGNASIEFVGKVPHAELPRVYREHDLFVFPSTWQEPFGLTHLEAMASGTPVISTADGGHGEFLKHEENALIFEKENAQQLAQHLVRLIRDEDLSRRLARNARAMVEREFIVERYVTDLESFLQETLNGNSHRKDAKSTKSGDW